MIELKDLHKTYLRHNKEMTVVEAVNLKVNKGDIFGVIGYSGAGKSTLIRLVNYLEKPTRGEVVIDGRAMSAYSPPQLRQVKQGIGMIFQHFNLLETRTVAQNIALPLVLAGMDKRAIQRRVDELIDFVELSGKAQTYPSELSGGQKQRVGIARALVNHPKILLCDEATSALDPQTTAAILALLKRINEQQKITIMMVTHEMEVVASICSQVAVMEQGRVIEQGSTLEIFGDPQQPTTRHFVNALIGEDLPIRVLENLGKQKSHLVFRLEFLGNSAREPVVNELILQDKVQVNILFANMMEIDGTILGSMFIQISGNAAAIEDAVTFLRNRGVKVTQRGVYV